MDLFSCSKRSSSSSSSGALVPTTPLLSQSGGDIFAAIVPPLRSYVRLEGFMKKKIAKWVNPSYVSLLLFSFFLIHILIVEFPYHLADPRLPLTLSRPLISLLVCPGVLSLRILNVRSARWL